MVRVVQESPYESYGMLYPTGSPYGAPYGGLCSAVYKGAHTRMSRMAIRRDERRMNRVLREVHICVVIRYGTPYIHRESVLDVRGPVRGGTRQKYPRVAEGSVVRE